MESFRTAFRDELDVGTVVSVTAIFAAFHLLAGLSAFAVVGAPVVLVGVAALNEVARAQEAVAPDLKRIAAAN